MTWLCGVVIVGIIAFLETMELSAISPNLKLGEMTLASFFPYMNAVLLSVLQVVPLVFLVKPLRGGDERVDSLEVVLTRPMGNAEYAWGVVWGFARVFLRMGLMATLVTMGIHLFASNEAPFNFWLYVFYYLTLVVPSFLFAMGVCLGVQTLLRRRVLSLTLLLVGWAVVLVEVGGGAGGGGGRLPRDVRPDGVDADGDFLGDDGAPGAGELPAATSGMGPGGGGADSMGGDGIPPVSE